MVFYTVFQVERTYPHHPNEDLVMIITVGIYMSLLAAVAYEDLKDACPSLQA